MTDIAIIGGGPAALGAALYAARSGMSVTIFEKKFIGGQASTTYEIDNYLGFSDLPSGSELAEKMQQHVAKFPVSFKYSEVKELQIEGDVKKIITAKREFEAKALILAMGATPSFLNVKGESEFSGKGVSYCATCDGMFFKGKTVAVVGGGNTAAEDAIYLSRIAKKVYIIHRRNEFRASPLLINQLRECENVEFLTPYRVEEILGEDTVTGIRVTSENKTDTIRTDGVFIAVGTTASNELIRDMILCDEKGFIITDESMATSVKGVFAAGDIRKKPLRQVITAVADGAVAAESAALYVNSKK